MFDANAAHIKEDEKFFAEVHAIDSQLECAGIKVGDIVLCEHIEKTSPRGNLVSKVWLCNQSDPIKWLFNPAAEDWAWLVYSGRPNGKGFINENWKQKALDFLGGNWR